jgi:hypothetical protein
MLFRTKGGTAAVTFLAAATALAAAAAGASCASQGQGTNETFNDGSADGTQPEASSSSGSGSGSGSSSGAGGCDANTMGDPYNCGSCGHRCPQGDICNCGQCMMQCASGMATCCSGCANLMTDPLNCGTCNSPCTNTGTGDILGTPECKGGQCLFTCPDGGPEGGPVITCGADAGGPGCFDPMTNAQACGGCGNVCPSGNCKQGVCQDASATTTGYTVTNPTLPFIDACSLPGHTTTLVSQTVWKYTAAVNLPISFTYFGTAQTQFWIGSQGTLGFGAINTLITPDGPSDCTMNWPPPTFPGMADPGQQYPEALAFGDANLATGANGVCYGETSADAGSGGPQFVVTWSQATLNTDPGSVLTFSIVLTQGTNTIDFLYQTMTGADGGLDNVVKGANATVGVQALHISPYTPASCAATFITSTPFAIRFTP